MADNEIVNIIVNLIDNASRRLDDLGKKAEKFGQQFRKSFENTKQVDQLNVSIAKLNKEIERNQDIIRTAKPFRIDPKTTQGYREASDALSILNKIADDFRKKRFEFGIDKRNLRNAARDLRKELADLPSEKQIDIKIVAQKEKISERISDADLEKKQFRARISTLRTQEAGIASEQAKINQRILKSRLESIKLSQISEGDRSPADKGRITKLSNQRNEDILRAAELRTKRAQIDVDVRPFQKKITDLQKEIDHYRVKLTKLNEITINPEIKFRREQLETAIREIETKISAISQQEVEIDIEIEEARRKINTVQQELRELSRQRYTPKVELEVRKAEAELHRLLALTSRLDRQRIRIKTDIDDGTPRIVRLINEEVQKFASFIKRSGENTSTLGRVIVILTIALSFILPVIIALGAALISLASAAILAGSAVGGVLAAGLAQALPVAGLLFAAFTRLKKIFASIKADNNAAARDSVGQADSTRQQADAANGLIQAQERLRDAQKNLTKARQDAIRSLEDLRLAEKSARLEQENAQLGAFGARLQLRKSVREGDAFAIRQAQLGVTGADINVDKTKIGSQRATADLGVAEGKGIGGSDQVTQARRQLRDATVALTTATENLAKATIGTTGADNTAAAALAKLNAVERGLKDALVRIRETFKTISLTDPILQAFTEVVDKANKIFSSPVVAIGAKGLATSIAASVKELFGQIFTPDTLSLFADILIQAQKTLPVAGRVLGSIFSFFLRVGAAAGPQLTRFFNAFDKWIQRVNSTAGGRQKLQNFFEKAGDAAATFGRLIGSLGGLLLALFDTSAPSGLSLVDSMTEGVEKLTNFINDNKDRVKKFFEDTAESARHLVDVVLSLLQAFSVNGDQINEIADLLTNSLIPAFGVLLGLVGGALSVLGQLSSLPLVGDILKYIFVFAGLTKILGVVTGAVSTLAVFIGSILTPILARFGIVLNKAFFTNPWIVAITAIIVVLLLLEGKFHFIRKAIEFLKVVADKVWEAIKVGALAVYDFFKKNSGTLNELFVKPFKDAYNNIKSIFNGIKNFISEILGGIKDIFSGFFDVLVGIFTGDGGKIQTGFKKIFSGMAAIVLAPLKLIYEGIRFVINGVTGIINKFRAVINKIPFLPNIPEIPLLPAAGDLFGGGTTDRTNTASGSRTPADRQFAHGGVIASTPGGQRVVVGEGGFDEFVLSTDPKLRTRTNKLLAAFFKRLTGRNIGDRRLSFLRKYADELYSADDSPNNADVGDVNPVKRSSPTTPTSPTSPADQSAPGEDSYSGLTGVLSRVVDFYRKLVSSTPGSQYVLSGKRAAGGKVAGSDRISLHGSGRAVDIGSRSIRNARTTQVIAPDLDSIASKARSYLGQGSAVSGVTSNSQGEVLWRTSHGGNHYDHVHVGLKFDSGGIVPGDGPQSVVAHGGEIILNKVQQAALGGAAFLKKLFGFKSNRGPFAEGGVVAFPAASSAQANTKINQLIPDIAKLRPGQFSNIDKYLTTYALLTKLLDENIEILNNNFKNYLTKIDIAIKAASFSFDKAGKVIQGDPVKILDLELGSLAVAQKELIGIDGILNRRLVKANAALARARKGPKKGRQSRIEIAQGEVNAAQSAIDQQAETKAELAQRIFQQTQARRDAIVATALEAGGAAAQTRTVERGIQIAKLLGRSIDSFLVESIEIKRTQIARLNEQLDAAYAAGDSTLVTQLQKEIADLDVSLREGIVERFRNSVEEAKKPFETALSLLDVQLQIAGLSGPGGGSDLAAQKAIIGQKGVTLQGVRAVLEQKLNEAIAAGLQDDVNGLRLQLAQNQLAILQNTQSLTDLSGAVTDNQGFSSLAWQQFRIAVTNGIGQLLPQFSIPSLASGGEIMKTGLVMVHAGEVVHAKDSPDWGGQGDTIIVNEANGPVDTNYLMSRLQFERKTRR